MAPPAHRWPLTIRGRATAATMAPRLAAGRPTDAGPATPVAGIVCENP